MAKFFSEVPTSRGTNHRNGNNEWKLKIAMARQFEVASSRLERRRAPRRCMQLKQQRTTANSPGSLVLHILMLESSDYGKYTPEGEEIGAGNELLWNAQPRGTR